jgi:hypothetical protein
MATVAATAAAAPATPAAAAAATRSKKHGGKSKEKATVGKAHGKAPHFRVVLRCSQHNRPWVVKALG